MEKISIEINNKKINAKEDKTILEVAKENNIDIPILCYHPDLPPRSSCRLCLVQIEGMKGPVTSCNTKIKDGMKISTDSDEIETLRRTNLELICGEHKLQCHTCSRSAHCPLLPLVKKLQANIQKFPQRKNSSKLFYGNALILDRSKCIECADCQIACQKLSVNYLKLEGSGINTKISGKSMQSCISCGQCSLHCPVGAIDAEDSIPTVLAALANKKQKVVIQFAPSIRVSIGQEFGVPPDVVMTGQLIAAIKKLKADWVVDTALGADFTTFAEAMELVDRLEKQENLPMFTACCPAWVNYVEFYRPDLIPHLTTIRSPHILLGGLIKHIFARRTKLAPEDIYVVSIMPCIAKKAEIKRTEVYHQNIPPVDAVLTTREFARLLKEKNIYLPDLPSEQPNTPLGVETGSGAIYGASGGVMEAALRSAYHFITHKNISTIDFKDVRGMKYVKEAEIKIKDRIIKIAVINGYQSVPLVLSRLKNNPQAYHFIEVMACLGGCIGGGGQPIPIDDNIRLARQNALYGIDRHNKIRCAHDNPVVRDVFQKELRYHPAKKVFLEDKYQKKPPTRIKEI